MVLLDLVTYLAAQSVGVAGTTLFYGTMPSTPDACVTLYEYGGLPTEPNMGGTTENLEYPAVQAAIRGTANDYDTARQKAQDVVTAFAKIGNQTLTPSGSSYKAVMAKQPPFLMRRDEQYRPIFVVNFQVTKAYTA